MKLTKAALQIREAVSAAGPQKLAFFLHALDIRRTHTKAEMLAALAASQSGHRSGTQVGLWATEYAATPHADMARVLDMMEIGYADEIKQLRCADCTGPTDAGRLCPRCADRHAALAVAHVVKVTFAACLDCGKPNDGPICDDCMEERR